MPRGDGTGPVGRRPGIGRAIDRGSAAKVVQPA
jgi:hypothetical protein